jgi:hypothetical protein
MEDDGAKLALKAVRAARKEAKRNEKASKHITREAERLKKALTCDERPHVRIAASEAIYGKSEVMLELETSPVNNEDGPSSSSLCGLNLTEFAPALLPSPLTCLQALNLSHNELSELPGIEQLSALTELDVCRNNFRILPSTLRQLPKLAKLNASRNNLRPSAEFLVLLLQEFLTLTLTLTLTAST